MTPMKLSRLTGSPFFAPGLLFVLVAFMFGDVLVMARDRVLSHDGTDTFLYFFYARDFGFGQIRQGNFPLWNPHLFAGTPFFGNLQPALLYPINWIHLVFPVQWAINLEIAIHVYLTGLGMYFWTRSQSLHRGACLLAAVMWMFGAPYFLKISAGHLAPLAAMCWIPWILLAIDWLFMQRSKAGCLLGVFAGAMLILAGHPQTAYNTAIAVMLYIALRFIESRERGRVVLGLLIIGIGAIALSAAQLGAGWSVAQESARAGAVPPDFARTFAEPPENFITLLAPKFFSFGPESNYWGRFYIWEVSLFMGVTGLLLALYGVLGKPRRTYHFWLPLLLLWLLAASASTPLFDLFYNYLPGFNKFRGHSKFIVPAAAFFAMLAAVGFDRLWSRHPGFSIKAWKFIGVLMLATITGLAGAALHLTNPTLWPRLIAAVGATQESYAPADFFTNALVMRQAAEAAGTSLLICSATCFLAAGLLWGMRRSKCFTIAIGCLAVIELLVFARSHRPTFDLAELKEFTTTMSVPEASGDERFLGTQSRNAALGSRTYDIWGYDPVVLGRYIQFMAWSQGYNPSEPNAANVKFRSYNRLYAMLRCRYLHLFNADGEPQIGQLPPALPRAFLVGEYSVVPERDEIFKTMSRAAFDPRRRVLLETEPNPKPAAGAVNGAARIIEFSTDHQIIEVETKQPVILLLTDSYSRDWKATALPGSAQQEYSVLPANYILRAIPLQAGSHRIRLEYSPSAFHVGKWISIAALIAYLLALVWFWRSKKPVRSLPRHDVAAAG